MILSSKSLTRALDLLARLPSSGAPDTLMVQFNGQKLSRTTGECSASIPLDGEGEGQGFVSMNLLRSLSLEDSVELTFGERLQIKSGTLKGSFSYLKEITHPEIPLEGDFQEVDLTPEHLIPPMDTLDGETNNAISTSINLRSGWAFGTTRGHFNLARKIDNDLVSVTITKEICAAILGFLPAKVSFYSNCLNLASEAGSFTGKIGEGAYPQWEPVLKIEAEPFACVKSTELRRTIESVIHVDALSRVTITADNGELRISAKGDLADLEKSVVAQTFSDASFTMNGAKLCRLLKHCQEDADLCWNAKENLLQVKNDQQLHQLKALVK